MQELTAPQKTDTSTFAEVSPPVEMTVRRFLVVAAITALVLQASFNSLLLIFVNLPHKGSSSDGEKLVHEVAPVDYLGFYAAGKIVVEGNRLHLYDPAAQAVMQHQIFPRVRFRHGAMLFYHPAYEVLPFALLALLPYSASYYVWTAASVVFLVLALQFSKPHLQHLLGCSRLLPVAMVLSFLPLFECLNTGQDSVLLLLIFVLSFAALKRTQHRAAGCLLSLGLFKFHFVVPFLLPFAFNKNTRTLLQGAFPGAVVLAFISLWITGIHGAIQYVHMVLLDPTLPEAASAFPAGMPNIRGLVMSTVGPRIGTHACQIVILLASLLLVGSVAYCFRRWWTEATADLLFSLSLVVALLVGYHTYPHDLTLLLLPLWLVGNYLAARCVPYRNIAIAIGTVLLATPIYGLCRVWSQEYWLGLPPLVAVCVLLILIYGEGNESAKQLTAACLGINV